MNVLTYDKDEETVTVALGLDKAPDRNTLGSRLFRSDGLFDLGKLVFDQLVLLIAVGVVLGEDLQCLLFPTVSNEPSGRLFDKAEQEKLDGAGDDLDQEAETVRPAARDVERAESDPSGDDRANVPAGVDKGGALSTVTRVRDFGNEGSTADTLRVSEVPIELRCRHKGG